MEPKIFLAPETLFHIGHFPVSNAFLTTIILSLSLIFIMFFVRFRFKKIPGRFQSVIEMLIESWLGLASSIMEDKKKARKVFPLIFTFFIFIAISNLFVILPLHTLYFYEGHEGMPFFRTATTDYSMILVLTVIAVFTVQIVAIISSGPFGYLKKYFNFSGPLNFFVGLLELVGEISKIVSLSFRLFGNIFAGEVLMLVILYLMPWILPLPFLLLAILVGVIQAFVFSILTLVFISLATKMEH